tara:strand:- start:286 stop:843 length:558 start_codon:yes stop_codon:yes gene_type:complete
MMVYIQIGIVIFLIFNFLSVYINMSNNNFTYLDDIIDMNDPSDQVENKHEVSQQPMHLQKNYINSIQSNPSSHQTMHMEPYRNNSPNFYTPYNKASNYTPEKVIQQFDSNLMPQKQHSQPPAYTELNNTQQFSYSPTMASDYQKLCYICQQINNQNNTRFHYVYLMIIMFLFVVILMLLKKVLNV